MKKSELRKIIREEIQTISESRMGHVTRTTGGTYVDTDFVQAAQSCFPNSPLKHIGMGDFMLDTPEGEIVFSRKSKTMPGFNGRCHDASDSKGGKLVLKLISNMKAKKKTLEV